jgi:signal transduction histidine kinase
VVNPAKILRASTASPAMSAASSMPSRRPSSQASINSHFGLPEPVLHDSPRPLTEWPFLQAFMREDLLHVEDASNLVQDFEIRCWEDVPTSAVMFALTEKGSKTPLAIMILGLNYRRPFDAAYREWLRQLRASLVNGLLSVRATEFEAMQRQSTLELERAKEVFFSNIAHELKSPLTLIAGPISDLVDIVRDEKSKTLLKMAQRNVARLARLVSNLMDFSRIEAGKLNGHFRNVNVGAVTANLASMWRSAIEKAGLKFVVDCDDSHTPQNAYIDLDCWEKILFNLISNAYKYTSDGTISVRLTYTQHSMELAVEDTGRGVSFASLPHLLERFHRSQEAEGSGVEGTGIGLAYTSELVKLHGGHLVVDSKVASESADGSHGSSFQVIIPLGTDHLDADRVETAEVEAQISKYGLDFIEEATYWSRDRSDGSSETMSDFGGSMESSEGSSLRGLGQTTLFFDKRKDVILVADDSTGVLQVF